MRRTGKAGLAKFVMGEREYLVAVRSVGGALSLITLHYNDEILAGLESPSAKEDLEPGEMSLLEKSVSGMVVEFKPDRYDDERRSRIHALLKMREKEHAVVQSPVVEEEEEGEGPADLVSMLKQSMERMKKR
jgi:DNA end-binding protein Ku